jgi:PKD repeat protein
MSPKKLIIALWAVVAAVALAIVFAPSSDGYREYAATQVAPAVKVAPAVVDVPVASEKSVPVSVVASSPAGVPAISLGGVSALLADASLAPVPASAPATPMAASAQPVAPTTVPVEASKDSKLPEISGEWRRASTVSKPEIEAAVERDAMTPETAVAFRAACDHDHDLHFDAKGKPVYACAMQIQVGPDTTRFTSTPSYPLADTFLLHSRPTATRKIYLDFNGHDTIGTQWNNGRNATLTTPPFSRDASPDFNDAEKAIVQESFRRIAEHFAPWNVDVTTEDPGVEGLRKTSVGDVNYGIRVVIGPKAFTISAAGVAYLNSFSDNIDTPCFTFAEASWDAALIAGVTSHEVGHTVSLVHQGQDPGAGGVRQEYFGGHGTGALSWSPIMGNGLRPVNQWAKGEYKDATSTQDNLVAIANSTSGIPPVSDDFGDTRDTATYAPGLSADVGGVIGSSDDVDMIRINAGRGNLVITPKVSLIAPNLRLQVRVMDATGKVLGTYLGSGVAGRMAPTPITVAIPAEGMHFIELDGVGNGTGGIPNGTGVTEGYTEYGSIGYYSLTASWADPVNKPPVANATLTTGSPYDYQAQPGAMVNFNGTLSTDPDGIIVRYIWDFKDLYPVGAAGATVTHRYKAPGTYYPTLTVIDDRGAAASTTVTVTVNGPLRNTPTCSLGLVTGSFVRLNSIHDAATATIRVQDQYGNPVRRALVYVSTTGLVAMKRTALRTDDLGQVNVSTPGFRRGARGSVVFTVSTVESPGRPFVNTSAAPVTAVAPTVTITR